MKLGHGPFGIRRKGVAPFVGAWIETPIKEECQDVKESLTLRGCVDCDLGLGGGCRWL